MESQNEGVFSVPREEEEEKNHIRIKVKNQHDTEEDAAFFMTIRKTTKLVKLMNAYSNHLQREPKELRFLYDGVLIGDDQTPADVCSLSHDFLVQLEMDDWDIVDCMDHMIGGRFF